MAKVDILNYISDSNILRSTYDTDTNELNITDVPQNLNSVITLGGGGGSGQWTSDGIAQGLEPYGDIVLGDDVTILKRYAFAFMPITSLTVNGNITSMGSSIIAGCKNITRLSMPNFTGTFDGTLSNSSIYDSDIRTSLSDLWIPKVTSLTGTWYGLPNLKILVLPSVTEIGLNGVGNGQDNNTKFEKIDLTNITKFNQYAFNNTTSSLTDVIIRATSIPVCVSGNSLPTRLTNYYIPKSLYDHLGDGTSMDYQNASNWATFYNNGYCNFVQIEGSIYDGYYANGTPIE